MTFPSILAPQPIGQIIGGKGLFATGRADAGSRLSYSVKRAEHRTSKPHGQTQHEARRLSDLVHFMRGRGWSENIWWATVGDLVLDFDTQAARSAFDRFLKRLVELQRRAGLPPYWIAIYEATEGAHLHVVFVGNADIAAALLRGFPDFLRRDKAVEWADDLHGLVDYLTKEMTQQAAAARLRIRKGMGKFHLEGGGDRVRPSRALKRDALDVNAIEHWQATNAWRKPAAFDRRKNKPAPVIVEPDLNAMVVQEPFLPFDFPKPRERFTAHHGGIMPSVAVEEFEFLRRRSGLTQDELGRRAHVSQPQISNAIAGRRGLSRHARQRILYVLRDQERMAA